MSSQSSAVYKPYPPPPMPCIFSTWEGTAMRRLCFTYGDFKKCCTYFNTMSTYAPPPCSHYTRPWFPCFADKFEKTRLEFQGLIQDCQLAMYKLTFVVQWPLCIKFARVQRKSFFTACHSGKLKLAFTSPDIIATSPKSFSSSRIDFTLLLLFEFPKEHHLPVGQVKNRFH